MRIICLRAAAIYVTQGLTDMMDSHSHFSHWILKTASDVTLASTGVSFNRSGHWCPGVMLLLYLLLTGTQSHSPEPCLLAPSHFLLLLALDHGNMVLVYWGSKNFRNKLSFKITVHLLLTFTSKMHLSLTCPRSEDIGFWVAVTFFMQTTVLCIHDFKGCFS